MYVGDELLIECIANANPEIKEYLWTVEHPHEPGIHSLTPHVPSKISNITGYDVNPYTNTELGGQFDGNVYKLDKVDERHNDMIVRCTVFNIIGDGTSETHLRVKSTYCLSVI